ALPISVGSAASADGVADWTLGAGVPADGFGDLAVRFGGSARGVQPAEEFSPPKSSAGRRAQRAESSAGRRFSARRGGDLSVGPAPALTPVPGALVVAIVPGLGELDPGGLQGVDLPFRVGGAVGGGAGEPVGLGDVLAERVDDPADLHLPPALAPEEGHGCPRVVLQLAGLAGRVAGGDVEAVLVEVLEDQGAAEIGRADV